MSKDVRALLDRALRLSPVRRAELARELIASIEPGLEGEDESPAVVGAAWRDEIASRLRDVEQGCAKLISSKKVHGEIRRALARRRASKRK